MKARVLGAIIASTLLGWAGVSFAQTSYGSGESARCNTMQGEEKEQCLRDEANKTQGAPADPAAAGTTRQPSSSSPSEQYGRSPRCDRLAGEAKEACLKDEARKGDPAASKTGD